MTRTIATVLVVGAGLALVLHFTRPVDPPKHSDCEAVTTSILRQPANALTALAIVAAGTVVGLGAGGPVRALGAAGAAAGVASFLAHATLHPFGQALDLAGVVFVAGAVVYLVVSLRPRWSALAPGGAVLLGGLVLWAASRAGGPACFPDAPLPGHAVWHLAAAAALLVTARFVQREIGQSD